MRGALLVALGFLAACDPETAVACESFFLERCPAECVRSAWYGCLTACESQQECEAGRKCATVGVDPTMEAVNANAEACVVTDD